MSGYYVGYHGSALVLREEEYDEMIATYQEKIVSRLKEPLREDFQNLVIDQDCLLSEYPFIRSTYHECDPNEILEDENETNSKIFDILNISADEFDGMLLFPYYCDGKLGLEHDTEISFHGENVYVIFSDIQLDSPLTFIRKPYESYDSFVNEMKGKLACYLPSDFDWDSHIGSFSYCSFV